MYFFQVNINNNKNNNDNNNCISIFKFNPRTLPKFKER